jgi:hypothetical protein
MKRISELKELVTPLANHVTVTLRVALKSLAPIAVLTALSLAGFVIFLGALLISPIHRCTRRCRHCAKCYRISYLHWPQH